MEARGSGFVQFGAALGLSFDERWYGRLIEG
jgi:hypothetical protein